MSDQLPPLLDPSRYPTTVRVGDEDPFMTAYGMRVQAYRDLLETIRQLHERIAALEERANANTQMGL